MSSFSLSGGVEVLGFISPTDTSDEYAVIDPLYGIDGLRNVASLSELNAITSLRRRSGMVVGVNNGSEYYKLNPPPWNGTISDWSLFTPGIFTGGTVTGDTVFTNNLSATTFSASTYLNLPIDNTVTGGTYDPSNGSVTFVNNTGGTFTVTGFITGFTDIQVTGYTYSDNTFTIFDSSGNTFSATIDTMTGLTVNGLLSATTISASTYQNLPITTLTVNSTPISGGTSGRVLFQSSANTLSQSSNLFWDNANGRLGVGTSSPGRPLTVVNSIFGVVALFGGQNAAPSWVGIGSINGGISPFIQGYDNSVIGTTKLSLNPNGSNVLIGTTTDAGFRLDVNGTARVQGEANVSFLSLGGNTAVNNSGSIMILGASGAWTGVRVPRYFEITGSINASAGFARGTFINQTLVATANNDTLYALDIAPSATTGSFTGVTSVPLRIRNTSGTGNAFYIDGIGNAVIGGSLNTGTLYGTANINLSSGSGNLLLQTNFTVNTGLTMFRNTRNIVIQDGGTFTDAGYRLDVNGTARVQGNLNVSTGGITLTGAQTIQTSTGNLTLSTAAGNGNILLTPNGSGTVNSSGNVVINLAGNGGLTLNGTSGIRQISYQVSGVTRWIQNVNENNFSISRYSASAVYIDNPISVRASNGFVGINETVPTQNLDVNGTGRIRNGVSLADTSGNVQIGTITDAGFKLDVSGNTRINGGLTATTISATTYQNLPSDVIIINSTPIQSGSTGRILFQSSASTVTQNSNLFWDNTNSRLGIGTATPGQPLDVLTTSDSTIQMRLTNNSSIISFEQVLDHNRIISINSAQNASKDFVIAGLNVVRYITFKANGNVLIGNTTDAGFKLDVNGTGRFQNQLTITPPTNTTALTVSGYNVTGSSSQIAIDIAGTWDTSGTPTLIKGNVTNTSSNANSLLMDLQVGGVSQFRVTRSGYGIINSIGTNINILSGNWYAKGIPVSMSSGIEIGIAFTQVISGTGGDARGFDSFTVFSPTSGNLTWVSYNTSPTINQTGGANGITRGLYINPTLTSAFDFRSIETTNGRVVITDTLTVTGSNATSLLDLSQTWNTSGTPSAIRLNITDTASSSVSRLLDFRVGSNVVLQVSKGGAITFGSFGSSIPAIGAANPITGSDLAPRTAIYLGGSVTSNTGYGIYLTAQSGTRTTTSGTNGHIYTRETFNPTGGTGTYDILTLGNTINQTGGSNGITRGLYVNPTLTSAFDFRAIETTVGNVTLNTVGGNTLIGTTTNAGFKLDVNGTGRFQNQLTLSPPTNTTALSVSGYNVTGSSVQNGVDITGTWNTSGTPTLIRGNVTNTTSGTESNLIDLQVGGVSQFRVNRLGQGFFAGSVNSVSGFNSTLGFFMNGFNHANLAGNRILINTTSATFSPTSGNNNFTLTNLGTTINQTGGANGITRGLYVDPTLTAAADWRSIEWSNNTGFGLYGAGTANNYLGGRLGIRTTNPQAILNVVNTGTTGTTALFSGAGQNVVTIVGSGSTQPIFTVQGSSGELFSVTDSLIGSLFSVNDISGLPILEVFSNNTVLMGTYLAPSLNTTSRVTANSGTTTVYTIPQSAYTGAFFEYTVSDGTNLRAGNIMSIWSGVTVNFTETQTTDIGSTSAIAFTMSANTSNVILQTSATTNNWIVKTIIRSI